MSNAATRILALADDMTGALEVGAKFNAAGIRAVVSAKLAPPLAAQAIVYDTETRHLSPSRATEVIKRLVSGVNRDFGEAGPLTAVYKKTDSTLRGNIAAELEALSDLFPDWRIGYVPAYPAQGRTVKNGVLYVDGIAVDQSSFGSDHLNPVSVSDIRTMLGCRLDCTIFDGELDSHIEDAARSILTDPSMRVLAGPAALAGEYAKLLAAQLGANRGPSELPTIASCLVMNGSRHERSIAQIRSAPILHGWHMIEMSHQGCAQPEQVAHANASYLLEQIASRDPDAVFVMGGATAYGLVAALGQPTLWPIRDVVHGIPVSRIYRAEISSVLPQRTRDLLLITKAGGFGELDVIRSVHRKLKINGA